jgi:peptide/nickel transport system substrate-binding protein
VDAAFAAAQTENDVAKRKELFARVQRLIQEDLPGLNLFELSFVTLYNSKLVTRPCSTSCWSGSLPPSS